MQTDKLRSYTPRDYPKLPDRDPAYITNELRTISAAISSIRSVMIELEKRIVALGG